MKKEAIVLPGDLIIFAMTKSDSIYELIKVFTPTRNALDFKNASH